MNRNQTSRRPDRRKVRRANNSARLVLAVVAIVAISIATYFIRVAVIIGVGTPTYYNVSVNGISLKGLTRSQADAMFDTLIADWQNRQFELTWEDRSWSFSPSTFDATLNVDDQLTLAWNMGHYGSISSRCKTILSMRDVPYTFTSDMKYDEARLDEFVEGIREEIDLAPVDAEVVLDVDAPRILTESSDGRQLDVEATKDAIYSLLLTGAGETALSVEVLKPAVSSDEVSGGLSVISSYKTDMSTSSSNRYKNVKRALSNFHAMAVYDGDIISFNEVVGERTAERGYMQAPEYSGTSVITGYGGGSCQASTTLYCAAIMAGMDIIERHPHNMTVAYAEPSLDATVSWGSKDFIFQNNTGSTIYIYTKVTRKNAWVVIYGNRPEYRMDFQSVIVKQGVAPYKEEIREDVTGQYVYYTDEKYTYSEGKYGCTSQGWLVYYDWDTGEEVKRVQVSQDPYAPGTSIVFVGVHERGADSTPEPAIPGF